MTAMTLKNLMSFFANTSKTLVLADRVGTGNGVAHLPATPFPRLTDDSLPDSYEVRETYHQESEEIAAGSLSRESAASLTRTPPVRGDRFASPRFCSPRVLSHFGRQPKFDRRKQNRSQNWGITQRSGRYDETTLLAAK